MLQHTTRGPQRYVRGLMAIVCACFSLPAFAAGTVAPNETLVLTSPSMPNLADGTTEDCQSFPEFIVKCFTGSDGERIGANTRANLGFRRASGTISEYYDFDVDPGAGNYDTVLNAQISGTGQLNGILVLIAGGHVKGSLSVKLYDLGETGGTMPPEPQLVHQESLASHELTGQLTTGVGFSIKVEGGAPYIGVGAAPSLGFKIKLQKKFVSDGINFGFGALVRRGHSYRVVFELSSYAKRNAANGISVSRFRDSTDDIPNLLDPENWRESLTGAIDTRLPALTGQAVQMRRGLNLFDNRRMYTAQYYDSTAGDWIGLPSTTAIINTQTPSDFPRNFGQIISDRFSFNRDNLEPLVDPGFALHELSVTLEADSVAILEDQTMRINEVIRLLMLPQGQRSTDLLECDGPGNSGSNGNNGNGNGNSTECRFPGFGGTTTSTSSGSSGSPTGASSGSGTGGAVAASAADTTTAGAGAFGILTLLAGLGLLAARVRGDADL
jgi:hypothetical protein